MINKSNDLPSFVNETNLPNIVNKLTDAKNIKISNNKYGNRVQTVVDKIVEKADDITKAIKQEVVNDSYSFKVGTGDVDISTDVQDGFGEVGIKGVTYQNIFNNFSMSGEASKYITVNGNTIKWTKSTVTTSNVNIKYHNSLAQLNKTYTLVFYIYKNTLQREGAGDSYSVAKFNIVSYNDGVYHIPVNKTGLVKVKLIQPTTIPSDGKPYLEVFKESVGELEISYPILLEGDHTNNPNLPSYFERIVGVGDKSKNLFNPNNSAFVEKQGDKYVATVSNASLNYDTLSLKPNTKYTVSAKFEKWLQLNIDGVVIASGSAINGVKWTFTTNNTGVTKFYFGANSPSDIGYSFIEPIQLEEGSTATPYEPYHDGHKIEILSHGKNLYKPNLQTKSANGLTFSLHGNTLIVNGTCTKYVDFRPVTTTLELYTYVNKLPIGTTLNLSNNLGLKNYFSLKRNGAQTYLTNTLIIQEGDYDIGCFVRFEEGQSYNNAELNIQLEINNVATEFEPYVSDKTQILLDEPLMRLPNGVCDEITRDGKLIKRIGKYIFTGDENISNWITTGENTYGVGFKDLSFGLGSYHHIEILSTILPNKSPSSINGANDVEGIALWDNNNFVRFRINRTRLDFQDATGVKKWLKNLYQQGTPLTIYYKLSEPTIIELPAPCLRIFKDGHLTFNTLVAPESSHLVQLNKSGQIQNAIKESQSLNNRINVLENNYDNLILFTMSRLNDLELNYTLK